jgi:uncharacterized membrane protein YoaK (UPF0700 family)
MPAVRDDARLTAVWVLAALLAACAGSVDTLAFFGLGHAFAGIVTGNLVTAGYGLASHNAALVDPTITAVAGSIAGEVIWARLLRRRTRNSLPLLIAEQGLLLIFLTAWIASDSHPHGIVALAMLAVASVALGGQSIWALRIHQTTTYFTGMLTTTINSAAGGSTASVRTSIRQLGALIAGAVLCGLVLNAWRPAAPALPLVFLTAATTIQTMIGYRARGSPARPRG